VTTILWTNQRKIPLFLLTTSADRIFTDTAGVAEIATDFRACTGGMRETGCLRRSCLKYSNYRGKIGGQAGDGKVKIAVAGACSTAGSTHLAIMLANYFANVRGMRTVVAECNNHRDFLKICIETDKVARDYRKFTYKNIIFATGEENGSSAADSAEVVIFDCGSEADTAKVFELADKRFAVLSASIYRMAKSKRFIEDVRCDCVYTCMFGGDAQVRELSKETGGRIERIPFEKDPFCLSKGTVSWLREIVKL
jgi:hypothetical protein